MRGAPGTGRRGQTRDDEDQDEAQASVPSSRVLPPAATRQPSIYASSYDSMTSELRHRSTHASPPASPPHLTRSFTEDTLSYSIPHDELSDLFSGLNLLDLLVMVQAHIELWSRGLRRTSSGWKWVPPSLSLRFLLMESGTGRRQTD